MANEPRENSGALFKNDRKEKETHPDFTGSCIINGQAFWISAWLKTSNTGGKFFSISFKPKEQQRQSSYSKPTASTAPKTPISDDDCPF